MANGQYMMCAGVKGEANPSKADFEKTTAKADLLQALKDSFSYCDGAYQISDMKAMEEITSEQRPHARRRRHVSGPTAGGAGTGCESADTQPDSPAW